MASTIAIQAGPGQHCVESVAAIDEQLLLLADGGNGRGRGGMISKLESARIVAQRRQAGGDCQRAYTARAGAHRCRRGCGHALCAHCGTGVAVIAAPQAAAAEARSTRALAQSARRASRVLASSSESARSSALEAIAAALSAAQADLLAANAVDLQRAASLPASDALPVATLARLKLDAHKLAEMIEQVRSVAALPDPLGRTLRRHGA